MISNQNNFFFVNDNINDNISKINKEELNYEESTRSHSFSTNATFENDFASDEEIDFNQDFFPQNKVIKFTDFLVDNWELKIKMFLSKTYQQMIKMKKNISNVNNNNDNLKI